MDKQSKITQLRFFLLIVFASLIVKGTAQDAADEGLVYEDKVYVDNIKTVQCYNGKDILSDPIVELNSSEQIVLRFDDMDAEIKDYIYTFVHCDKNWKPSALEDIEYIDGFTDEEIDYAEFSTNTLVEYSHYSIALPNENITWTLSGNYLLKVYEDEDEKKLVLTRRFMVVESIMSIAISLDYPTNVGKLKTHHEIDFDIIHKDVRIKNPQNDIYVVVMQNDRWDNAITDLVPIFYRENKLVYDYQDKIVFPALKEFRWLDMRSFRFKSDKIRNIERFSDGYIVDLKRDKKRGFKPFSTVFDVNGNFIIQDLDRTQNLISTNTVTLRNLFNKELATYDVERNNLETDYADVYFSLAAPVEIDDREVYLFGAFSEWGLRDEFKMEYNDELKAYETKVELKQGYYNYFYAVIDPKTKEIDLEEIEGNWYETENEYSILVYYTPQGAQYDKLVAVKQFRSTFDD